MNIIYLYIYINVYQHRKEKRINTPPDLTYLETETSE